MTACGVCMSTADESADKISWSDKRSSLITAITALYSLCSHFPSGLVFLSCHSDITYALSGELCYASCPNISDNTELIAFTSLLVVSYLAVISFPQLHPWLSLAVLLTLLLSFPTQQSHKVICQHHVSDYSVLFLSTTLTSRNSHLQSHVGKASLLVRHFEMSCFYFNSGKFSSGKVAEHAVPSFSPVSLECPPWLLRWDSELAESAPKSGFLLTYF